MKHIFSQHNRALLSQLVKSDFKLRYQNSVLGYMWSLLRPLMLFMILYVVVVKFFNAGKGIPHFGVYLLLGIVIWNFFVEMTTQSLGSIVTRGDLIRKVKIPRWIIIVSVSVSALINLSLNMIIVIVFMAIDKVGFSGSMLWFPIIIIHIYLFSLGVSLFLSAAFVKYRDVSYIWEVIMQALFYLTPILYALNSIKFPPQYIKLLMMSPLAVIIQDARYAIITHETVTIHQLYTTAWHTVIPYLLTLLILVAGILYFKKESKYFAENI